MVVLNSKPLQFKILEFIYNSPIAGYPGCDGTKLEQAVDHKHSIYYKGEERVGEATRRS